MTRTYRDWPPILEWLLQEVTALSYRPSLRWCFYRAMGKFGLGKRDAKNFSKALSTARKLEQGGWKPDTLADESRKVRNNWIGMGTGSSSYEQFEEQVGFNIRYAFDSVFSASVQWIQDIDFYAEVWYEAEAMSGQFEKYIPYEIPLRPFRGDYSIPKKWETAQTLRFAAMELKNYGKDPKIIVLYFGDLDKKGLSIAQSALKDIKKWAMAHFEFHRIGLTPSQVKKFRLPENPERPGQHQWEALSDEQARSIIEQGLSLLPMHELEEARDRANKQQERWHQRYLRENPEVARLVARMTDAVTEKER